MERENNHEREPYTFSLEFDGGETFKCHPHNTMAFIHSQEPQGDHLFLYRLNEEGEIEWGTYVWRRRIAQFDELVLKMAHDYDIIERDILNDEDRERYNEYVMTYAEQPQQPAPEPPKPPTSDKELLELEKRFEASKKPPTERQEKFMRYFGHILLNNHLTPDEFRNVNGDLFL